MKRIALNFFALFLLLGLVLAVNSCSKDDMVEDRDLALDLKSGVTTLVSGHGTINDYPDIGLKRQFSFNAKVMPDGTVKGSGVLSYTSGELVSSFDITCMVVEGNIARLAGIETKNTLNPNYVGQGIFFAVQDNGEGKEESALPDIITLMYVGLSLPADCDVYFNALGYPSAFFIEGGNIQVMP